MVIGVIGSGSIGPDLAYAFLSAIGSQSGSKVFLLDIKKEALDAGVSRIHGYVEKGLSRGRLSPKAAEGIRRALVPTLDMAELAPCDYVLEAASEDLAVKRTILARLESVVSAGCLIGFATSGIPRAEIAAAATHPGRCFVNHPFFPAWRSLPVEVVLSDDAPVAGRMIQTLMALSKVPIITADVPCFAADDIFCTYCAEAARIFTEGLATPAQVDRVVNDAIGGGGPFAVMDLTRGNLLTAHCLELMRHSPTGTEWFRPPDILTKQGLTPWLDPKNPGDSGTTDEVARQVLDRILAVLLARTYFVIDHGVCNASDLNWLTRNALGFREGLVDLAEALGADNVAELCESYAARNPGFVVPPSIASRRLAVFRRHVTVERDGPIAIVTIRRPEVKNALSAETMREIREVIDTLGKDAGVGGIVLTGFGGALAGADINELAALATPEACEAMCTSGHAVLDVIVRCLKPVVAAVDGPVLGGGCELSMACHARVVGKHLMLGQPEVNLGIIPGYGGTQRLPRLIGVERGLDLLRTGRAVGAAEACAWGWATGEPSDDPVAAAKALISAHLDGKLAITPLDPAPVSVPAMSPPVDIGHHSVAIDAVLVDVVRRGLARPLGEGLAIEAAGFGSCRRTVDMDIGMKNFMQNGPRVPAAFLHE
ncbi:MAG: 3-hydroxyacyl-CoA dehydrogenase/enoyl-CoA hydratase family protein [Acidobacteriota bacterium]